MAFVVAAAVEAYTVVMLKGVLCTWVMLHYYSCPENDSNPAEIENKQVDS